jgi:uncharacterized protein YidB (DUF937 family)
MGLLDGVLGGIVGAGLTKVVEKVIEQNGGIQGLANQFSQNGMGGIIQSWIGTGANQAIEPQQIQQALGSSNMLQDLAAKAGLSVEDLSAKLAELLPQTVDKMTPNGQISDAA